MDSFTSILDILGMTAFSGSASDTTDRDAVSTSAIKLPLGSDFDGDEDEHFNGLDYESNAKGNHTYCVIA
jgi:hypothetical protein